MRGRPSQVILHFIRFSKMGTLLTLRYIFNLRKIFEFGRACGKVFNYKKSLRPNK